MCTCTRWNSCTIEIFCSYALNNNIQVTVGAEKSPSPLTYHIKQWHKPTSISYEYWGMRNTLIPLAFVIIRITYTSHNRTLRDCGMNCSVRKSTVYVHCPLHPAACRASTATSQPRPLPTVVRVAMRRPRAASRNYGAYFRGTDGRFRLLVYDDFPPRYFVC